MSDLVLRLDDDFVIHRVSPLIDVSPLLAGSDLPPTHPIFSWVEIFDKTAVRPLGDEVGSRFTPGSLIEFDVASALQTNPWRSQVEFDNRASARLVPIGHGPQAQTLHLGNDGGFFASMDDSLWRAGVSLIELARVSYKLLPTGEIL